MIASTKHYYRFWHEACYMVDCRGLFESGFQTTQCRQFGSEGVCHAKSCDCTGVFLSLGILHFHLIAGLFEHVSLSASRGGAISRVDGAGVLVYRLGCPIPGDQELVDANGSSGTTGTS